MSHSIDVRSETLDYCVIMRLSFLCSAVKPNDWPKADLPEIALAGRSNAGKSSWINTLAGQKVAKVSQVPGKTRLLNFFQAGDKYRLVDMPGYGFASRSGDEMEGWGPMVETFLRGRSNLVGILLLMDIRRDWSEEETQVVQFAARFGRAIAVVLTKADKLSRTDLDRRKKYFAQASEVKDFFAGSALDTKAVTEVEDFIFHNWIKAASR
jgi:GTP-binding protein